MLILIAFVFVGCTKKEGEYDSSITTLGINFTAKSMCSCLWVSENTEDFCLEYTKLKQVTPSISVDHEAKTVTASFFWFLKNKARFIDSRQGCQLGVKN